MALIRAQAPEAIGTEKPMDLMLLNAVRGADALPPPDPWLSNEPLSYYHLGHTAVDAVAQLAGVSTGVAFSLGLAAVAAMLVAAVFGLASDLVASTSKRRATPWIAGGIAVVATLWLAPLEGATQIASAHGLANDLWVRAGVDGLPGTEETAGLVPTEFWWWWRATRVIPGTITEFPAFSFVLGDLHAHVMVLPLTVAGIALAAQTYEGGEPLTWRRWIAQPGRLVVALDPAGSDHDDERVGRHHGGRALGGCRFRRCLAHRLDALARTDRRGALSRAAHRRCAGCSPTHSSMASTRPTPASPWSRVRRTRRASHCSGCPWRCCRSSASC